MQTRAPAVHRIIEVYSHRLDTQAPTRRPKLLSITFSLCCITLRKLDRTMSGCPDMIHTVHLSRLFTRQLCHPPNSIHNSNPMHSFCFPFILAIFSPCLPFYSILLPIPSTAILFLFHRPAFFSSFITASLRLISSILPPFPTV